MFQLDSDGMRSLLKTLKPDNFNDISALIALYRPGPMSMDSHTNYAKRKTVCRRSRQFTLSLRSL